MSESDESELSTHEVLLDDNLSDLETPPGNFKPGDDDASCLFCEGKFSSDVRGELWVMCLVCRLWAHSECAGAEKDAYVCDFCK